MKTRYVQHFIQLKQISKGLSSFQIKFFEVEELASKRFGDAISPMTKEISHRLFFPIYNIWNLFI
jgi:hypothetical protein